MAKFKVAIEESLVSVLWVEADTETEAANKAFEIFHDDGEIRQEVAGYRVSVAAKDGEFEHWEDVQ